MDQTINQTLFQSNYSLSGSTENNGKEPLRPPSPNSPSCVTESGNQQLPTKKSQEAVDLSNLQPIEKTTTSVKAPSSDKSNSSSRRDNARIAWNATIDGLREKKNGTNSHSDDHGEGKGGKSRFHFHLRGYDDSEEVDWWFASTACPLLAATIAPLANVLSIAALVTNWRMNVNDGNGGLVPDFQGVQFKDPRWCYWINVGSLVCGFVGNLFLLLNFTGRIRYIVALPATILFFYIATSMLIGITVGLHVYAPPVGPFEIYSQGFWYAVISIVLYFVSSTLLMANMAGYFLGHYPQRFELNEHQRTLILQTMLFFIWLAGGGAMFAGVENNNANGDRPWAFVDGLYFCDVTILTLGFGDQTPHNDLGRGLVFPYSVGGIVMLGLVISSISRFAAEMGEENVVRKHFDRERTRTLERTISNPNEAENVESSHHFMGKTIISAPFHMRKSHKRARDGSHPRRSSSQRRGSIIPAVHKRMTLREAIRTKRKKLKTLAHERDRFNEMRRIQKATQSFKRWWALTLSVISFSVLWCVGALVFWRTEAPGQGWRYFDALYFSYVSLLTIGYGDFAPTSNAGRAFFVVWSLIAVPTMTLLISDMSSTVIEAFKQGTFIAADFTVLLKKNVWHDFLDSHPSLKAFITGYQERRAVKKRLSEGLLPPSADNGNGTAENGMASFRPSIDTLATEVTNDASRPPKIGHLARRLAVAIRSVSSDVSAGGDKQYSFEEWAELTRLIRFCGQRFDTAMEEEDYDVIEWDWLGEDSPLMTNLSEPEFVLEKLCEGLVRYTKRVEKRVDWGRREIRRMRKGRTKQPEREDASDHSTDLAAA